MCTKEKVLTALTNNDTNNIRILHGELQNKLREITYLKPSEIIPCVDSIRNRDAEFYIPDNVKKASQVYAFR